MFIARQMAVLAWRGYKVSILLGIFIVTRSQIRDLIRNENFEYSTFRNLISGKVC